MVSSDPAAAAAPATPAASAWKTVTLSDGRVVALREPRGEHLERGALVAQHATSPISLLLGVVSQVATIDGHALIYEQIRELPMVDALALVGAVGGGGAVGNVGGVAGGPWAEPARGPSGPSRPSSGSAG